jgi:NAD(P)-dependent dehydrogenase (short-subunit alcohol dehydrogenase family)
MSTIAIVGVGPLLGMGLARTFGKKGFKVALVARREKALQEYVAQLKAQGIDAAGFAADATSQSELAAAFKKIKERFGSVDVLEYSPTQWTPDKQTNALATTPESALADFKLLVYGAIASVEQVLPEMLKKGAGALFFTTGYSAIKPLAFITSLCISNSGLRSYAYCLSEEIAPKGIYVGTVSINAFIAPGTDGDPDKIADVYWDMYQKKDRIEEIYSAPH